MSIAQAQEPAPVTAPPVAPAAGLSLLEAIEAAKKGKVPLVPSPFGKGVAPAGSAPGAANAPVVPPPVDVVKTTPSVTQPAVPAPVGVPPTSPAEAPAPVVASPAPDSWKPESISLRKDISVKQPKFASEAGMTLRFDNADIYEVVQAVMGEFLGLNFIVDPGIQGKININSQTPISGADLFGVLQSVLALNNVSIVREGNLYKVLRDSMVPRDAIAGSAIGDNGAMVQIFAPKFIQPSALIGVLKNFVGPQAGIINDVTNRYLIVTDRARNMQKLQELIETLDIDYLSQVLIDIVPVENGDATELAKEMDILFKSSQLYNWPGTEPNKVFFMPIKRMNAILIGTANKPMLAAAKIRLKQMDALPPTGIGSLINIYSVRNSSAEYLASMVSQIYGGPAIAPSTPTSSSSGTAATRVVQKGPVPSATATGTGLTGEVRFIPNEKSNSIIVKANRQDYLQVLKLLEQLDTLPRQVLIQANVIEVTLSGSKSLGLEWSLLNEKVRVSGTERSAEAKFTSGLSTTPGNLLYTLFDNQQMAIATIQAAASDSDINVLSSPRIVASDGKEAKIEIGQEVPVTTQQVSTVNTAATPTNGTTLSSTVTYRTVGLILKVKPSINESGQVNLQLSQEVSSVPPGVNNQSTTTPTFTTRKIETEVTIQEGKTLTIGGLIRDENGLTDVGVPYLKDVPVLGNLFGKTTRSSSRTELILTITPYVMRNQGDADRINQQLDEAMQTIRAFTQKIDPKKLDLAKPAAPPAVPAPDVIQ